MCAQIVQCAVHIQCMSMMCREIMFCETHDVFALVPAKSGVCYIGRQVTAAEHELEADSPGFVALEESPPLFVALLAGQVQRPDHIAAFPAKVVDVCTHGCQAHHRHRRTSRLCCCTDLLQEGDWAVATAAAQGLQAIIVRAQVGIYLCPELLLSWACLHVDLLENVASLSSQRCGSVCRGHSSDR